MLSLFARTGFLSILWWFLIATVIIVPIDGFLLLPQSGQASSVVSPVSTTAQDEAQVLPTNRRNFLAAALVLTTTAASKPAHALDMDSFVNQELATSSDANNKKLSDDEALCKFGQPSKDRGDACVRAGMSTTLKKGGVDAYGNVDRGNFVRCKIVYVDDPDIKGFLMKTTVCE